MTPKNEKKIRVRFAPSPTGPLNIGGVRTALFNWLFAKKMVGDFILRIEDTDIQRSEKKFEEDIQKSLVWLGLEWNELYRQSERIEIYESYLLSLLEKKQAYYCFCTEEELEAEYNSQLAQGITPKYGGRCERIPKEEAEERAKKEKAMIRFRTPEKEISFHDLVRGKITFDAKLIGDFIIAKGIKEPLYNFANVVDDFEMNITHVIRGEEHTSNTPRQIVMQESLEFPPLVYAHLPLILGQNKKKLSKRDLAKSILDYRKEGYLPESILNFLVLLGWHPQKDREVLSVKEMIEEFGFERVQKAGGIFNPEKLDWLNGHYIREKSVEELTHLLLPIIPEGWKSDNERLRKAVEMEKDRIKRLDEFPRIADFFFSIPEYDKNILVWKNSDEKTAVEVLESFKKEISLKNEIRSKEDVENILNSLAEKFGKGPVFWPVRAALSGKSASPGPVELAFALGKKEILYRISFALEKCEK